MQRFCDALIRRRQRDSRAVERVMRLRGDGIEYASATLRMAGDADVCNVNPMIELAIGGFVELQQFGCGSVGRLACASARIFVAYDDEAP